MKRNMTAVCWTIAMLWGQTAFAHHLWVQQQDDGYAICRGIIPGRLDEYDPARVTEVMAFSKDGAPVQVERQDESHGAFFRSETEISMAAVRCDWGQRVNTTQGKRLITVAQAQEQGLRVIDSFFSTQFGKSLLAPGEGNTRTTQLRLELTPLVDPLSLAKGEPLPVRLLFEGEPLTNTPVYVEKGPQMATDDEGIAQVLLEKSGMLVISARHRLPAAADAGFDYHVFTAFLNFEVE